MSVRIVWLYKVKKISAPLTIIRGEMTASVFAAKEFLTLVKKILTSVKGKVSKNPAEGCLLPTLKRRLIAQRLVC